MLNGKDMDRMTGATQEMVAVQRDAQEAVANNFAAFQRNSMGLAQDGLKFLEFQQDNVRAAQEWWSSGVRMMQLQQRNVDFARSWMTDGAKAIQDQTEQNIRTAETFARSYRAQQENFRNLTEMWAGTYQNFFSPFVEYAQEGMKNAQQATQQGLENTQQATRRGLKVAEEATAQTEDAIRQTELQSAVLSALKTDDYDELNVGDISKKLDGLSDDELKKVREYEKRHKNRETLVEQIDRRIKASS